ncbi:DUF1553 domain-containing protein [Arenibacter sp. BSSL-BM3]|uniref:DUF1553 domain-containing protein n=1 Tax=Arenibacter arenosicollis TaxID=2762274 RepID=A0ABR7QKI2_9FLAO|nr:DUF1553 domain-containing protein [Arenibacter arenosicollis]MBC8767706.1 DUF1553 domain-containing protein [Arenibacter arenosicollis]
MEDINWIFQLLGRFHPLLVHFPVGLLVVAFVFELFTIGGKRQGLRDGIYWMLIVGAATAIIAALMGWLLSTYDDYTGDLVSYHQYTGMATAFFAVVTLLLLRNVVNKKLHDYRIYRFGLFLTVLFLTIAGHLGASLTHGEDYLTSVLPGNNNTYDNSKSLALLTELKKTDSLSLVQKDKLNLEVRAIFAHNCYQCHSDNKQKGELMLDSKEGVFKGGESGPVIVAGKPVESELFKRITLSPNDDNVMPKKGKVLKENEIALIKLWILNGAHWSDQALKVFPEAELALVKPDLPNAQNQTHPVDKLVDSYFRKNDIDWPEVVNDRTFIRRSYMDIIGLLPEPADVKEFMEDSNPNKRNALIDRLLGDTHNYTQNWLSFWNDLLRNDYSGTGFITGGRKQITEWLYTSLEENKRYDLMVKQLVNPTEVSEGFIKGIEWRGVVNSSQRTEMQAAQNIGQSLLGVNVKCASCHNSFVSNLTLEQSYGFASIFADSVLELNRCDKPIGKMAKVNFLYPELGDVEAESLKERLLKLSEVIVKPENGRLYRTITNRFWERLMGRGIVEPLDEMDNEPWDSDLLDWLASDFVDSGYDLKHLIKQIMSSKVYQLPTANYKNMEEIKSDYVFKGPLLKRMSAEQFSDAVSQLIKPVYAAVAYNPKGSELPSSRVWHREMKFDRDVLPEPGKRYFRKTFPLPDKSVKNAIVLISVDHSYTLYINEKKISQGTDWTKVDKLNVQEVLTNGTNTIAIEGVNEGKIANPAGILFSMKINFSDGSEIMLNSDNSWKSTADRPNEGWTSTGYDDSKWEEVRNFGTSNWGKLIAFTFKDHDGEFARASLVEQHPFMKALGRPSRENVTTSRDEQATLLQALELTNGEFFNNVLEEGADIWLKKYGSDTEKIIRQLYQKSLGREPTDQEKKIMITALGNQPKKEGLQDLFWSTLISPEFQFIN